MMMVVMGITDSLTLPSSAVSLPVAYMFTDTLQCGEALEVLEKWL